MLEKKVKFVKLNVAVGEAGLLILSIIAVSFLIGQIDVVSAADSGDPTNPKNPSDNPISGEGSVASAPAAAPLDAPAPTPPPANPSPNNPNTGELFSSGAGILVTPGKTAGVIGKMSFIKPGRSFGFEHGSLSGNVESFSNVPNSNGLYPGKMDGQDVFFSKEEVDFMNANGGGSFYNDGTARAKVPLVGTEVFGMKAHLVQGIGYAMLAVTLIQLVGRLAGADDKLVNTLSIAAGSGIILGKLAYGAVKEGVIGSGGKFLGMGGSTFGFVVGVGVAAAIFIAMYKKEEQKIIKFECLPWEPPLGGAKCDECNKDIKRPCTEYRCKALGQACELENKGTGKEQCVYKGVKDAKSPIITPWIDALSPGALKYEPDKSIRPPSVGVRIVDEKNSGKCLPAYTPLKFGVTTDEPAQCKIDFNITATFDQMQYYFGDNSLYAKNHTQQMRLPAPDSDALGETSPLIQNGGKMTLFVRCRDVNGNFNNDAFAMSFCVNSGPDTTPPIIEGFSIPSENYVQYNADKVGIEAYVNEPSECKWSIQDKNYDTMENQMSCAKESVEINANLLYTCKSELTGIKNREDNTFYFRCKDNTGKPDKDRNVNIKSTPLVLKGSQPLTISSVTPNETISGSTDIVSVELEVTTTNGAEDGKAVCLFALPGDKDYVEMFETGGIVHSQTQTLPAGEFTYKFKCVDAGGNTAEATTSFKVRVDKEAPKATRIYRKSHEAISLVTDEDAVCVYSFATCNYQFDKGIEFVNSPASIKNVHLAEWKDNSIYYIKCRDMFGNEVDPGKCNIVASSSKIVKSVSTG